MVLITLDINGLDFTGDASFGSGKFPCFTGELHNDRDGGDAYVKAERFCANNVQGYITSKDGYSGNFWGSLQPNPENF